MGVRKGFTGDAAGLGRQIQQSKEASEAGGRKQGERRTRGEKPGCQGRPWFFLLVSWGWGSAQTG